MINQVPGHAQPVQGVVEVGGGAIEMRFGDAQAPMRPGDVGSPVALGAAQRLAQDRHHVGPMPRAGAMGKEGAQHGVGEQPPVEVVHGGGQGGSPTDRLVDADRPGSHGHDRSPG